MQLSNHTHKITKERFFILASSFSNQKEEYSEELEYYETTTGYYLGVLFKDKIDEDYNYCILHKFKNEKFHFFLMSEEFFSDINHARKILIYDLEKLENNVYKEIISEKKPVRTELDLFIPIVSRSKINNTYNALKNSIGYSPAKELINYVFVHDFQDPDGTFIREFQSEGFNARLWEIYLSLVLKENNIEFLREKASCDFQCNKNSIDFNLEATIIQSKDAIIENSNMPSMNIKNKIIALLNKKYSSRLSKKRDKNYFNLDSNKEIPFIYAIHNFCNDSNLYSDNISIFTFLYGLKQYPLLDPQARLKILTTKDKPGYFFQNDTQYVSAVIHSNSATISKFERIGFLAGFGSRKLQIIYTGYCYKHNSESTKGAFFYFNIEPNKYSERWSCGIDIYHNPNAINKINPLLFPYCNHHFLNDKNELVSNIVW